MKELLIAVDSGKFLTKAITKIGNNIEKISFRTKVQEICQLGVDITPNHYNYMGKNKSPVFSR